MISAQTMFRREEVVNAVQGIVIQQGHRRDEYLGVSTDTRDDLEGMLFVALWGRVYNAHNFLVQAVEAGAAGLLVSREAFHAVGGVASISKEVDVIAVEDSLWGLGELASFHRDRVNVPVIGVTGSNGKTTTKEMIASLLKPHCNVWTTPGNLNNLIGLPFTLLALRPHHDWCVAEMGMNARGEIARLTEIAKPRVRLVTNIGPAHIGELGSLEQVALAKGELFENPQPLDVAVVNVDDQRVVGLKGLAAFQCKRTFGRGPADVQVHHTETTPKGLRIVFQLQGKEGEVALPLYGDHNAINAAGAIAAVSAVLPTPPSFSSLQDNFRGLTTTGGRLNVRNVGLYTVVDDSYNANLVSGLSAIRTSAQMAERSRLVVAFGEMLELGEFSIDAHREIGRELARVGAAVVAAFGSGAAPIGDALSSMTSFRHEVDDFSALSEWFMTELQEGDVILLKGSRGSRMERILEYLEGMA